MRHGQKKNVKYIYFNNDIKKFQIADTASNYNKLLKTPVPN